MSWCAVQGDSTSAELQKVQADKQRLEVQVQQALTEAVQAQKSLEGQIQTQAQQASGLLSTLQECFGIGSDLQGRLQAAQGGALAPALHDLHNVVHFSIGLMFQHLDEL